MESNITDNIKTKRVLNTFILKIIAIITMTIDHAAVIFALSYNDKTGKYFLNGTISMDTYMAMRYIGRIAFPIFCYLIVEGFFHTANVYKYCGRLLAFAIISQIPFTLMQYSVCFKPAGGLNTFFTLLLGLIVIICLDYCIEKYKSQSTNTFVLTLGFAIFILIACIAELIKTDYGALGIIFIVVFYVFRGRPVMISTAFGGILGIAYIVFSNKAEIVALFALIPIFLHNGKKGPGLKYFFYLYYPLHILILFFLKQYII